MTTQPAAPRPRPITRSSSPARWTSERGGPPAHRFLLAAGALVVAALLAGCSAGPGPLVTVFTPGDGSVSVAPQCWNDQEAVDPASCDYALDKVGTLDVQPGDTIGISVDVALTEGRGWIPAVSGQALVPEPLTGSYYRFAVDEATFAAAENQELELVVYAASEADDVNRGTWVVQLNRR